MQLKKAKTPRKKKQGSVKRASIKRRVSVRRGGRSSRTAPRSKSSRRLIRGGGRKTNIALGTGIAAIGGSYMLQYYNQQKVKNWYDKTFRPSSKIVSDYLQLYYSSRGETFAGESKIKVLFDNLPHVMGNTEYKKFSCISHYKSNFLFFEKFAIEHADAVQRVSTTSGDVESIKSPTTSDGAAGGSLGMYPVVAPTATVAAACSMDSDEDFLLYCIMVQIYNNTNI